LHLFLVGIPIVGSPQTVLSVGFEAVASPATEFKIVTQSFFILHNELQTYSQNSKIRFRSIHVVGEATALFPCSTPTTGSFIFREDRQRIKV
jgi:hypothetical protein